MEAAEDPSAFEMSSRATPYKVGYVLGRSFYEAVKHGSHTAVAVTAGELGAKYGLSRSDLLAALNLTAVQEKQFDDAHH
ncbi:hypothetical protein NK8_05020 [Caballeronia sp. NK8]|nr:hypothetical protein NK8_05020 [Caballeronia sp. NK8]